MKKRLIIAGAGGFATEVAEYLRQDIAAGKLADCELAGVLEDAVARTDRDRNALPGTLLGGVADYRFRENEYAVIAVGSPQLREKFARSLQGNGARFLTYIHSSCYVAANARIGQGVVVCPFSILNYGCNVGDFAALNVFTSVGHGSTIGACAVLSPYAAVNGEASIGERSFLATRATIFPKVSVGSDCAVDTHSFVKASVGDRVMISSRGDYRVVQNRLLERDAP